VTTAPSSAPAVGSQGPRHQPGHTAAEIVIPDQDLVKDVLEQMKLSYMVDQDGDLGAQWAGFRTYFVFSGEDKQEVYSVRTYYDRAYPIEDRPRLLDAADDWNRRKLWPKVYTFTHDDGSVRLIGESQMPIGTGVALKHFVATTVNWVCAAIEFDRWLIEQPSLNPGSAEGWMLGGADQ
jgi:hypothetical protein